MFAVTPIAIVGLAGGAGVGKDTLAEKYFKPLGYMPVALADEIKFRVVAAGKATYEEVYITKPPHIRTLLQQEGTEKSRDVYGENFWIDQLTARLGYYNIRWGFNKFVITDVRFVNEAEAVKKSGVLFKIDAPARYAANGLSAEARLHRSEIGLNDFTAYDGRISNDIGEEGGVEAQIHTLLRVRPELADARFHNVRLGVTAEKFSGTIEEYHV